MVQDAVEDIAVMTFLAYRFIPASILVAIIFRKRLGSLGRDGIWAGLLIGVFLTAGYIFQTMGLQHTTAANAGFITGLFVVLTPLFGAVFLGQSAGRVAWIAAGVSAVGLYLLTGAGNDSNLLGDALVFGCACSFAFHILMTDRALRHHHPGALLFVQLALCGVVCFAVAAAMGDLSVPSTSDVWSALVVTSVFASALGFYVQTWAQQHAPPDRIALILATEPAFAGLFAWLLQGDSLTAAGWLGAALIMGAIVAVEGLPYLKVFTRPLPER
jgi:drug/metabolite transporter (DMT)-like permease